MIKELIFDSEELLPIEDGYKAIVLQCEWEWVRTYDFGGESDGEVLQLKRVTWDGDDYTGEEKKLIKGWVKANWDMLNEEALCD
jgi:hypothetical protein